MDKVRTIRLYGKLGVAFGRIHRFVVKSPKDAVKALAVMIPGFERDLMTSKDRGIRYAVFVGRRNITEKELEYPSGEDDIRIAPIAVGAKSGLFQTILGAALIAASFFVPGAGAFGIAALSQGAFFGLGVSLALGGIAQMLSPHPSAMNGNSGTQKVSYYFSGAQNTAYQGGPVPLLYGQMTVGSTVISEGIVSYDT
ncbi:tail assembly protein [Burkholderia vietnamiensis]|uniref:tail assembly protein n=1 Tax=Burkholderia vietnamiensis TaxID=60552 RepID=UPI00075243AE|nr:tail assembly protein [Burkholderia vietnamiensis]KVR97197.1 phage tail protein [Burkholderia vietnamiensis]